MNKSMKKLIDISGLALLFLAGLLAAPGAGFCGPDGPEEIRTLRLATLATDGIGWSRHIKNLIYPVIEEATDGHVKVKMYWGGIMGDEEEVIRKMEKGILQGGAFTNQGAVLLCPAFSVLQLPFLFNSYEEVDYLRPRMRPEFDRLMRENGFFLVAWTDQDFDQVYSMKYPMATVEDFARSRILVWCGPMEDELVRSFGATPVHADVPDVSALARNRGADAAIGPAIWVLGSQLHPVVKYINPVKIRYSPSVSVITIDTWNRIPEKYQKVFYEIQEGLMYEFCLAVREENAKTLNAFFEYGLARTDMDPQNLAALKARTRVVWERTEGKLYPKALLDQILTHLEAFRKGKQ